MKYDMIIKINTNPVQITKKKHIDIFNLFKLNKNKIEKKSRYIQKIFHILIKTEEITFK